MGVIVDVVLWLVERWVERKLRKSREARQARGEAARSEEKVRREMGGQTRNSEWRAWWEVSESRGEKAWSPVVDVWADSWESD